MSEENLPVEISTIPDVSEPSEESKGITLEDWDKLADKVRKTLAVSLVAELMYPNSKKILSVDECMKIYKTNPAIFYFINKQTTEVMGSFRNLLEETAGVKVTG